MMLLALLATLWLAPSDTTAAPAAPPAVRVWLAGADLYRRGERARVLFRSESDAYVMVLRIDTDGRLHVLYPEWPDAESRVRGGVTYTATARGHESFVVRDDPGLGYIVAIASASPLALDGVREGHRWQYRALGDPVVHDPSLAAQEIAERVSGASVALASYAVERHAEYPRFLCYECHQFRPYSVWDPYAHACARYRVVVYDAASYPFRSASPRGVVVAAAPSAAFELREQTPGGGPESTTVVEHRARMGEPAARGEPSVSTPVDAAVPVGVPRLAPAPAPVIVTPRRLSTEPPAPSPSKPLARPAPPPHAKPLPPPAARKPPR